MTPQEQTWYQEALDAYIAEARAHAWNDGGKLWNLCVKATRFGVDFDQLENEIQSTLGSAYSRKHADCLRRTFDKTSTKYGGGVRTSPRRWKAEPRTEPNDYERGTVRRYIEAGRGGTEADLFALSFYKPDGTAADTVMFLVSLWGPDELLSLRTKGPQFAKLGVTVRRQREWVDELLNEYPLPGDLVGVNAIDPAKAAQMDGRRGVRGEDLAEPKRYAVLEMDD